MKNLDLGIKSLEKISLVATVASLLATGITTMLKPKLEQAKIQEEVAKIVNK